MRSALGSWATGGKSVEQGGRAMSTKADAKIGANAPKGVNMKASALKKAAPKAPAKKDMMGAMPMMKKGGAIDGVAVRGKTKGTMVKMASGGMAKGKKYC